MRCRHLTIVVLIVSLLAATPGWAQQSVVTRADLNAAMAGKTAQEDADRALVRSVLRDERVRQVAENLSLDITRAEEAVATLSGDDLETAAASARAIQQDLAGAASTVTISLTVALLIIIIIILLVK